MPVCVGGSGAANSQHPTHLVHWLQQDIGGELRCHREEEEDFTRLTPGACRQRSRDTGSIHHGIHRRETRRRGGRLSFHGKERTEITRSTRSNTGEEVLRGRGRGSERKRKRFWEVMRGRGSERKSFWEEEEEEERSAAERWGSSCRWVVECWMSVKKKKNTVYKTIRRNWTRVKEMKYKRYTTLMNWYY